MKSRNSIFTVLMLFAALFLASCNGSVKGKWSEADKQKFHNDMDAIEELSSFGENKSKWVNCYLSKCEATYSSYYKADTDQRGCEILALECSEEVLSNGSVKGNWSDADKQRFRNDMEGVDELSGFGENKSKWIDCYLSKCEVNYASYYKANTEVEGCQRIAQECSEEFS